MSIRTVGQLLGGSFIVYAVCAACSSVADAPGQLGPHEGPGASTGIVVRTARADDTTQDAGSGTTAPATNYTGEVITSGTRLRARYVVESYTDGARFTRFASWHDTQRDEDCSMTTYQGETRCMPRWVSRSNSYYSDASCTNIAGTANIAYPYMDDNGHLYPVQAAAKAYVIGTPGTCIAQSLASGTIVLGKSGPEVPATAFVSGTATTTIDAR